MNRGGGRSGCGENLWGKKDTEVEKGEEVEEAEETEKCGGY